MLSRLSSCRPVLRVRPLWRYQSNATIIDPVWESVERSERRENGGGEGHRGGDGVDRALLCRIIRVDHAGEFGADRLYAGQSAVLGRGPVGPIIQKMWDEEKEHLQKFEELMIRHRVRPTALLPIWNVAGFLIGAGTALLGKEGAMACTVAVEETISEHYNNQIRTLMERNPEQYTELLQVLKKFRDDEMEHLDTGLEHDAEQAPGYTVLKTAIQLGCKAAICLSERI
uniref:5-demethoxyubiquinone hydroxylase, mitochondrial n=1 Tax=Myxine glutinosa TaxID=7769 RepID=UPI00358EBD4E